VTVPTPENRISPERKEYRRGKRIPHVSTWSQLAELVQLHLDQ
jgi:hypothetical protein